MPGYDTATGDSAALPMRSRTSSASGYVRCETATARHTNVPARSRMICCCAPGTADRQQGRASTVIWDVQSCAFLHAQPSSTGGRDPEFRQEGVNPQMERWDIRRPGWDQYLPAGATTSRPAPVIRSLARPGRAWVGAQLRLPQTRGRA